MRYILNTETDPAFNLAAEEWLLDHADQDIFMLWRNAPAIIVGRNQNASAQIDEAYVRAHDIKVIRRLSGGGAVFHDLGNINFSYISLNHSQGSGLDFRRFTAPIIQAVNALGVTCAFDGRNDLVIDGRKISGNAQHVRGDRVLHHGTLLFSARMADLSAALRVDPRKYQDKSVKSVEKRVTNISEYLPQPMEVTQFMNYPMRHVSAGAVDGLAEGDPGLTEAERRAIATLTRAKYATWEWNFGKTPAYGFTRSGRTTGGMLEIHLDVRNGVIRQTRILGEYFGEMDIGGLERKLTGCRHDRLALAERLTGFPLDLYLRGVGLDELLDCLF